MPRNSRLLIPKIQSSDEDDYLTYWRQKPEQQTQVEWKKNDDFEIIDLDINESELDVVEPFIYRRDTLAQWKDDVDLGMFTRSQLINLYWECKENGHLLKILHETCRDMQIITKSEGYILYVVDDMKEQIFFCSKTRQELTGKRYTWKIGAGKTIATFVAREKKCVMKNDDSIDARYPDGQDLGSLYASNIIAAPIKDEAIVVAVVELCRLNGTAYTEYDLQTVKYLTHLAGQVLVQNRKIAITKKCNEANEFLLNNLRKFSDSTSEQIDSFTMDVVNSAVCMLNCESVTYFSLTEAEQLERIYTNHNNPVLHLDTNKKKMRISKETKIANVIKNSKTIVNFADVFNDPRFNQDIDRRIGLLIRSVLGGVICQRTQKCCGALMAINKQLEEKFTVADERVFEIITKYLEVGLEFMAAFVRLDRQKREHLWLSEMVTYQISRRSTIGETYNIQETIYIPANFYEFSFVPDDPDLIEIPKYIFYMINAMASNFIPDKDVLYKLIFAAKKLYRQNPFHNFHHAFKCVHVEYLIFRIHPDFFSPLEKYAMLVAALLHDCDHRGVTATFLSQTNHPIIDKSETTPVEIHQCNLAKMLLKRIKILEYLTPEQLDTFEVIFKDCIIASNIGVYLKRRMKLRPLLETELIDWNNEQHRLLIRTMIVTSADCSGIAKSEDYALEMTRALYTEFFREDDLIQENKFNISTVHRRKDKLHIPKNEAIFCDNIALPCFGMLLQLLPGTAPLYFNTIKTGEMWKRMANEIKETEETDKIPDNIVSYIMSIG